MTSNSALKSIRISEVIRNPFFLMSLFFGFCFFLFFGLMVLINEDMNTSISIGLIGAISHTYSVRKIFKFKSKSV